MAMSGATADMRRVSSFSQGARKSHAQDDDVAKSKPAPASWRVCGSVAPRVQAMNIVSGALCRVAAMRWRQNEAGTW